MTPKEHKLMRRVAGDHNIRLDGMGDLLLRARGASVMDIGCNRGQVGYEFYQNGATLVHGCDNYAQGIAAAREWFADLRRVQSRFEVVDLTLGPSALAPFGTQRYDIVLMLATYHKLKREMPAGRLSGLMKWLADRTIRYFAWRGTSDKPIENEEEMVAIDKDLAACSLRRVHTSYISKMLGVAAIWERVP